MDLYKEFVEFAESHNVTPKEALSKIAAIRSFRPETMKPKGKKGKRTRSPYYLRFIEKAPCVFCGGVKGVEAMLVKPDGSITVNRASDYSALPICKKCADYQTNRDALVLFHKVLQVRFLQTYLQCIEGT